MGRPGRKLNPEVVALGRNLARLRRDRGLTQVQVAAKLGIPQSVVSQYERGDLRLHGQLLVRLSRILSITTDEILGLKEAPRSRNGQELQFLKRAQQIDRLSRRDRQALLRTIDAFLSKAS